MSEQPTPAFKVSLPIVRRNAEGMADYCRTTGLALRPHFKTHKSLTIAKLQMACGAVGLACATVGELALAAGVCDDLLLAYPALDAPRCSRLAEIATRRTVRVAVDSALAVDALAGAGRSAGSEIGILVDLDVGFHRTGVQTPAEALDLARRIAGADGARLDGIMIYPGHVGDPPDRQAGELTRIDGMVRETLELWRGDGLEASVVSGGSTPTARQSHLLECLTEIRPGTYIYNDMNTASRGYCSEDDCAAAVLFTVISDAVGGKVVLDGGSKALSSDPLLGHPDGGFGRLVGYPDARIVRLSEEHAEVDVTGCAPRPSLGDRVEVIPNHVCPCVNCFDSFLLAAEDGTVEVLPVDARGMLN